MHKPEKIALFDLDGTLANYHGRMVQDLEKLRSPNEPVYTDDFQENAPAYLEERMELVKRQPGWWRGLDVLEDGMTILGSAVALGFEPHILTKGPFKTVSAWSEKVEWVRSNVDPFVKKIDPTMPVRITITEDKGIAYGTVLVEDWPPYIERWLKWRRRGLVIILDRPYNQNFKHPQVVRFDGSAGSDREVGERLTQAYDRQRLQESTDAEFDTLNSVLKELNETQYPPD